MQKLIQFFQEEKLGLLFFIAVPAFICAAWGAGPTVLWYVAFFTGIAYAPFHV